MREIKTIADVCCVLEKALKEYPGTGPGIKQYRAKSPDGVFSTTGQLWDTIPLRYVMALTGLSETELRTVNQKDYKGNIYFELSHGKQTVSITSRQNKFEYIDPDEEIPVVEVDDDVYEK